jgi:hypothetical protein
VSFTFTCAEKGHVYPCAEGSEVTAASEKTENNEVSQLWNKHLCPATEPST